jgi:hypothetical protein
MKHEDVVEYLKMIAEKGKAINISKEDVTNLKAYNLIEIEPGEENYKSPSCTLTKKGRVMLKSNTKEQQPKTDVPPSE